MLSWDDYHRYRISPEHANELRHDDIVRHLESFVAAHPNFAQVRLLGNSVEDRPISLLTLGTGTKSVLAWTQMHGNEPTHTAALLDIVNFLLTDADHPIAKAILADCQLHFILMLNPDGAERWTRRNAQDIDMNRDALHLQSPEGRILHAIVDELQPDFALNLHNHRPHTTVGQSQQPATFSLLVPPVDASETDTEPVLRAKQLASYLAETVASHCPGPVSRYDADYMPRCFGEWVQQQGAATLTIEAGGWSTIDAEPLVQLHFFALCACLESIASDCFLDAEAAVYEQLPRTGEHDLFDKLLRGVTVINGLGQAPFNADIGINFDRTTPTTQGGTILDLGDLHVTTGKRLTQGGDLLCLPGKMAWLPAVTPGQLPDEELIKKLLATGVTTLLGTIDLAEVDDLSALSLLRKEYSSPLNLGFLGKLTDGAPEILDRLVQAISHGLLGVLATDLPAEVKLYLSLFNFPVIAEAQLPSTVTSAATASDCATQTQLCAQHLRLNGRGAIHLGATADLLLYQATKESAESKPLAHDDLHRVFVGGNVVFDQGKLTGATPGALLDCLASHR